MSIVREPGEFHQSPHIKPIEEVKQMRNARVIWVVFVIIMALLYLYLYSPWAQVLPRF